MKNFNAILRSAGRLMVRHDVVRWGVSGAVVLSLHAAALSLALMSSVDGEIAGDQFTMTINLDVTPAAPVIGQTEANQGVQQLQTEEVSQASVAQEEVRETVEEKREEIPQERIVVEREPEVVLPELKREQEKSEKKRQEASEARNESAAMSAPIAAQQLAPQATLTRGVQTDDQATFMSWRTLLASHVQRYKRYPAAALARSLHGTTTVSFTIDRRGRLIDSTVRGSSGTPVLDSEALTLLARAVPLPAAPDELRGESFTFTIPVRFNPPK